MKRLTALTIVVGFVLVFGQASFAQHAEHDKKEGMACCEKGMEGGHDMGGHDKKGHGKEMSMTHLVIMHEVEDVDHWLAAWRGEDSRHALFKAHGAEHVHVVKSGENPNVTGLVVAVEDMDKFMAMLESEEGQAAATEDGVKLDTMTILEETR